MSGGWGKMQEHSLFSFSLSPPPPTLLFIDWEGDWRRRGTQKIHVISPFPLSLSCNVKILFSSQCTEMSDEEWRLDKRKQNKASRRVRVQKDRKKGKKRTAGTSKHAGINSIYFTTKQNKSAWRKDFPGSNSQIKQALIKTSLSLAVLQITSTNSISWKHTFHTKTVTKHIPLLHFHSNNLNPRDPYQWSRRT